MMFWRIPTSKVTVMTYRPLKPRPKRGSDWMKGFVIPPRETEIDLFQKEAVVETKYRALKRNKMKGKL